MRRHQEKFIRRSSGLSENRKVKTSDVANFGRPSQATINKGVVTRRLSRVKVTLAQIPGESS